MYLPLESVITHVDLCGNLKFISLPPRLIFRAWHFSLGTAQLWCSYLLSAPGWSFNFLIWRNGFALGIYFHLFLLAQNSIKLFCFNQELSFITGGIFQVPRGFPGGSDSKESACSVKVPGSIPGLGRSPGEGNGYPLQDSCLENSMDKGSWPFTVHGVTKSRTQLSN